MLEHELKLRRDFSRSWASEPKIFRERNPYGRRQLRREPEVILSESTHPFKVTAFDDGGVWKFQVEPGIYDGEIPFLGGFSLDTFPIGVLGAGVKYVYIEAQHDLLNTDNYVYSGFLTPPSNIVVKSVLETSPLGPNTTGLYYHLLASFNDGEKTGQYITNSFYVEVADDGTASSSAFCFITAGV